MSNQKLFVFIFNGAGECVSFEMDDDVKDGMWVDIPCADHKASKKKCDCPDKKRVFKPFVRNVCDRCFKRKKKCTHEKLASKPKRVLGGTKKPALKTKRVQEEQPTSYEAPKEPAVGGKGAVDEEPFPFEEELDLNFWDDKQEYDAFKAEEPAAGGKRAVEKERVPEEHESGLNFWDDKEEYDRFKAGLRGLLDTNELR